MGLKDWGGTGTPNNEKLVHAAVSLCADIGRPVANHDSTVELLGLALP